MNENIIAALNWRYAVKEFDASRKVSEADLRTILESARLAPSSLGIEAWKFIVVENPQVRAALREASYGQSKVSEASHIIVLTRRTDIRENIANERIARTAATQHRQPEDLVGLRGVLEGGIAAKDDATLKTWTTAQTYIALGMMVETASLLGIDNCPMEGFNPAQVDEVLNLSAQNLTSISMLAVGYRGEDPSASLPKTRRSFDEVIEFVR